MKTRTGLWAVRLPAVALAVIMAIVLAVVLLPSIAAANPLAQLRPQQQVYIPMIAAYDVAATPAPTLVTGNRVYGLLGTLERSNERLYDNYLVTRNGTFALAGLTPDLEAELSALASTPGTQIKVWGEVTDESGGPEPLIVVSGILPQTRPATPAPVQAASVPIAIVKFDLVNLRARPVTTAERVGAVKLNQACDIVGRNAQGTWWELSCADGQRGWIDARLVEVQGSTSGVEIVDITQPRQVVAPPTPLPTPTPAPAQFSGWRAEFFDNPNLSGSPKLVLDVAAINYDWGVAAPASTLPADGFSARFERTIDVPPGYYQITAQADDGVRVWLDGDLIIDEWRGAANRVHSVGRVLNGRHQLRVEYHEVSGAARLRVDYKVTDQRLVWEADYYRGVVPDGTPVLSQMEPRAQNPLDYNWGNSSPAPDVLGTDFWSARWQGTFYFDSGNYLFRANADDGVRVYIDDLLVIDRWDDGYKETSNRILGVGSGDHRITVEYYERTGAASVAVWWIRESAYTGPQ